MGGAGRWGERGRQTERRRRLGITSRSSVNEVTWTTNPCKPKHYEPKVGNPNSGATAGQM